MSFTTSMEAKRFLVSRITDEARREDVPLSELEQKMLFFSEQYPTLPDMAEVNERFESEYDDEKYEERIARLSKAAYDRDRKDSPETAQRWIDAIKVLKKEDHYILVMIYQPRPPGDWWKLVMTAVVVVVLGSFALVGFNWLAGHVRVRVSDNVKLLAFGLLVALVVFLGLNDKAGKVVSNALGDVIERVVKLR